ncbi:MAG: hypothetical protein CM15mP74_08550 [Halieaceae bacterium]|nr:MAG: hypothetical protein CM15mP74_08550 [Halieaceae bacterium]
MPSVQYGSDIIGEPLKSMAAAWDVNSDDYVGRDTWQQLRVDIQAAKRERGEAQGYVHYSYRADYQLTDYVIYNLFPNNVITVGPDGVQLLRPRPHPTDPAQCLFDHWWLVNRVEGQEMTRPGGWARPAGCRRAPRAYSVWRKDAGYHGGSRPEHRRDAAEGPGVSGVPGLLDAESRAARAGLSRAPERFDVRLTMAQGPGSSLLLCSRESAVDDDIKLVRCRLGP